MKIINLYKIQQPSCRLSTKKKCCASWRKPCCINTKNAKAATLAVWAQLGQHSFFCKDEEQHTELQSSLLYRWIPWAQGTQDCSVCQPRHTFCLWERRKFRLLKAKHPQLQRSRPRKRLACLQESRMSQICNIFSENLEENYGKNMQWSMSSVTGSFIPQTHVQQQSTFTTNIFVS